MNTGGRRGTGDRIDDRIDDRMKDRTRVAGAARNGPGHEPETETEPANARVREGAPGDAFAGLQLLEFPV